jgi:16S rRNA (guanine527-N7)-methyltransferase
LKLITPDMRLTLVESVAKKTVFMQQVMQELGLEGVEILNIRAEEVGQLPLHREQYDWAVARAVAGLPTLAEYLLPLVRIGGFALAQKGESAEKEAEAAHSAIVILGGALEDLIEVKLPGIDEKRYLVIIKKMEATPSKYPRRVGVPAKRPLG